MAKSPIERTLDRIGNVVQDIFTGPSEPPVVKSMNGSTTGQTCLEKVGMEARKTHLMRNEWRKDLEYSKPLVLAEYEIQTEFKVSTADDDVATQLMNTQQKEREKKLKAQEKAKKKADKKARKEEKVQSQVAGVPEDAQPAGANTKTEPVETIVLPEKQSYIPVIGNDMFKHGFGSDAREYTNNANEARNNSYNR